MLVCVFGGRVGVGGLLADLVQFRLFLCGCGVSAISIMISGFCIARSEPKRLSTATQEFGIRASTLSHFTLSLPRKVPWHV